MIEEIDVWRTANPLIKQHGEDAPIHAAMRADELLTKGDAEAHATCIRIAKAVKELLDDQPPGDGEVVH
jgi:hypothetical protein